MSHPEIRVQYDAINAVIAAAQEILIKSAQPVPHEGHGRYSGVLTQAAPKGPLFRSSSVRNGVDSYQSNYRQNDSEIVERLRDCRTALLSGGENVDDVFD